MNQKTKNIITRVNWDSIRSLLDDDSEKVRNGLIEFFSALPEESRNFLLSLSGGDDKYLAKQAQSLIERLGWIDGPGDFINFIRSLRYELETGWFLLDRTMYPNLEVSTYTFLLDSLADRCRELLVTPSGARQTCAVINRVLFHEYGFRGARQDFENPDNSFIHRVLDRREGLPITLCSIYILVARRIGFELDPIGSPGRFLLGCFAEKQPFYLDCWAGGRLIELDQMEDKLGVLSDEDAGAALLPVTTAETLARACRNLSHHYAKVKEFSRSRMFESFDLEFDRVHQEASNA